MIELKQIIVVLTALSMAPSFSEAIYRIVTESDYMRTWKEKAISCIVSGIIDMILLLVMKLSGWW